jgi:DNA-binding beta-propeller fold protein YncE
MRAWMIVGLLLCCEVYAAENGVLTIEAKIPLPRVKGRFDHFAIDEKGKRLFVAALGNSTVEVIDLEKHKPLTSIRGIEKPTGVCFVPEKNWIGVANGDRGTFEVFDGKSYRMLHSLKGLDDADNVRFDPEKNICYVGYGNGGIAAIDMAAVQMVGSLKLKGHPESFQLQKKGPLVFVNVPDAQQVAVMDRNSMSIVHEWAIPRFGANFPMALDETNHRLFVGCRTPAQLVVLNTDDGAMVAHLDICGDTDDLFYDPKVKRVLISCGAGKVDVVGQESIDSYKAVASMNTRTGARTSFFSEEMGLFAVAVPEHNGAKAELWVIR